MSAAMAAHSLAAPPNVSTTNASTNRCTQTIQAFRPEGALRVEGNAGRDLRRNCSRVTDEYVGRPHERPPLGTHVPRGRLPRGRQYGTVSTCKELLRDLIDPIAEERDDHHVRGAGVRKREERCRLHLDGQDASLSPQPKLVGRFPIRCIGRPRRPRLTWAVTVPSSCASNSAGPGVGVTIVADGGT
jgi:hypothetical protein